MLYYFYNTSWQILFYFGFLEVILDLKILRPFGLEMQELSGQTEHFFPLKFPKQSWWFSTLLVLVTDYSSY